MAFALTLDHVPEISSSDMDATNEVVRPVFDELRSTHRRWSERALPRWLTSAEAVTLGAIVSRTFGWRKVVEVIPLSVFVDGLRDPTTGKLRLDEHGLPFFGGTGMDRKTLRKALDGLASKGLIARFVCTRSGRDAFAYMPVSAFCLLSFTLRFADRYPMELPRSVIDAARDPVTDLEDAFAGRLRLIETGELDWG